MNIFDISPFEWEAIFCCFLSALIIGLERQLHGKPVGIRTSSLICIGTYIFIALSRQVSNESTDPSRIVGQVVTGIGFLGAGVILTKDGIVVGVTSAAAIWILAAIGVVVGLGYYWIGVKIGVLTIAILVGVDLMENSFEFLQRGVHSKLKGIHERKKDTSSPITRSSE